jgi:hypothetical protein
MSLIQIRQELHEIIEKSDDSVVEAMYVVYQSLMDKNNDIIGFSAAGEPLTWQDFIARIRTSYSAGKRGEVKSAEQLLKAIETW